MDSHEHGAFCAPDRKTYRKPMVFQWFWRAPPLQNAKFTGNREFMSFPQTFVEIYEIHEIPHIPVISMHFGVKDASRIIGKP